MLNVHFSLLPKWRARRRRARDARRRRRDRCQHHDARTGIDTAPAPGKRVAIDDKTLRRCSMNWQLGAQALTRSSVAAITSEPTRKEATRRTRELTKEDFHLTSFVATQLLRIVRLARRTSKWERRIWSRVRRHSTATKCEWFDHAAKRSGRAGLRERSCWSGCARKREIHECVVVVVGARFDHDVANGPEQPTANRLPCDFHRCWPSGALRVARPFWPPTLGP